jgi:hypothetical protein
MYCSVSIKVWSEILSQHEGLNDEKAEETFFSAPNLQIFRGGLSELSTLNESGYKALVIESHFLGDLGEVPSSVEKEKGLAPHVRFHISVGCNENLSAKFLEGCGHGFSNSKALIQTKKRDPTRESDRAQMGPEGLTNYQR